MAHRTALLIIDAQNDFCDLPEAWCPPDPLGPGLLRPALPVAGAHADLLRLAAMIGAHAAQIDAITLTQDAHHHFDIAHPSFWQRADGGPVAPFTEISAEALRSDQVRPRWPAHRLRAQAYLDALQAGGRYTLMVWPVHCQIGTWGQGLHASVLAACNAWEALHGRPVTCVSKGDNPWTEHYSALMAEVPDASDPASGLNHALLARLAAADRLLVAGQASSHCVRATLDHLLAHGPAGWASRLVLLTDCTSPVAGFEAQQAALLADMAAQGVTLATSTTAWPA